MSFLDELRAAGLIALLYGVVVGSFAFGLVLGMILGAVA